MHQDQEWARDHSPFGGTIAYGFLAVALLSHLFKSAQAGSAGEPYVRSGFLCLNYGFDKLRLVRPIPAGSRIRGRFSVLDGSGRTPAGHAILKLSCRIEVEGQQTPALVGEWLTVAVPSSRGPEEKRECGTTR
jgi:acyl dehydratase